MQTYVPEQTCRLEMFDTGRGCSLLSETTDVGRSNDSRGWLSDGTNNERSSQELSTYHSKYIHDTICSDYVHCRINVTATAHWCENLGCSVVDSCSASLLFERYWRSHGTNNERSSQELSTYHSKYIQDVADKCLMKQLPPERR